MSRKEWSEQQRHATIMAKQQKIHTLEREIEHLCSSDWEEPYPKENF